MGIHWASGIYWSPEDSTHKWSVTVSFDVWFNPIVEYTAALPVIWDTVTLMQHHSNTVMHVSLNEVSDAYFITVTS